MTDRFASLPPSPPDIVYGLDAKAKAAPEPKINLVIGAYRDGQGKPYPLKVVRKAERLLLEKQLNKEYLPIEGMTEFCDASVKLLFGSDGPNRKRIAAVQAISGTGACRLAAEFLVRAMPRSTQVLISDPTWPNHGPIFSQSGFLNVGTYRYFDKKTNLVDMKGLLEDLERAPNNSVVVLHACAHNPTGADPSPKDWEKIADVMAKKAHFPVFDSAYQGYASGDLDRDAYSVRYFAKRGFELAACQSYAKNLGLYNERTGCFSVLCKSPEAAELVFGLVKNIIRPLYSNPPANGARIAHLIMTTPELFAEWRVELKSMADRIILMRKILFDELQRLKTPGNWEHVTKQIGMFSYLGLSPVQSKQLQDKRIFVMLSSRASIAGLTEESAKRLAKGIDEVVRGASSKL